MSVDVVEAKDVLGGEELYYSWVQEGVALFRRLQLLGEPSSPEAIEVQEQLNYLVEQTMDLVNML